MIRRLLLCLSLTLAPLASHALDLAQTKFILQGGLYHATQGTPQNIHINGLIGNRYTIKDSNQTGGLIGTGLYFSTLDNALYLGINGYMLAKTTIEGKVVQEQLFENLKYRYDLIHFPIYAALKAHFAIDDCYAVTVDAGLGPNIIKLHNYHDESNDGGVTFSDDAFKSDTNVRFSGMIGVGFEVNNLLYNQPIEIGYRFFYLGEGSFPGRTNHIQQLDTGTMYAHSLIVTFLFDV